MKRFILLFCQRQIPARRMAGGRLWWTGLIILVFLANVGLAEIPKMINYQGMLTDDSGDPIDGNPNIVFRIYDDTTGGTQKWTETHSGVPVSNGLFNVILGSDVPIDTLSFSQQYWLEVQLDDDTMPRIRFTSVGYAYRAQMADTADYALAAGGGGDNDWTFHITDTADTTLMTGGAWGIARYGNVLYGNRDSTHVNLGVSGVTGFDGQNYKYCTVSGGIGNTARGEGTVVGGGQYNDASFDHATVCGGRSNSAINGEATVGGGYANTASGFRATIGGGSGNAAGGTYGAVGGGLQNTAGGVYAGAFSGYSNLAGDQTTDTAACVGGGYDNAATGQFATVTGGRENNASGNWAAIGGGRYNIASNTCATIAGGYANEATSLYSTVGGGQSNTASEQYTTVAGGFLNSAVGRWSTVAGGIGNNAGDWDNDSAAFVGGGSYNAATSMFATVLGGHGNDNDGAFSVICGGYKDTLTVDADHSMAFGEGVYLDTSYQVVFFDGDNSGRLGINRDDRDGGIDYPIHVGTDATNGNGAHLTADGVWTNASSRTVKTDFESLDAEQILAQISNLPVESWRYKGSRGRHIGPYAEDFAQIFAVGTARENGTIEDKYLAAADVAGVSLAGVKALIQQNQELRQIVEELSQKIAELERGK